MLEETGTVVKIEPEALWVETVRQSTCGSCSARKGCGQQVLARALATSSVIRVLLDGKSPSAYRLSQQVVIGIPEDVVVKGSLLIYFVPLLCLMAFAAVGHSLVPSDGISALLGGVGLAVGGLVVHWYSRKTRHDPRLQPVILDA